MADAARRGHVWLIDLGVPLGSEPGKVRPALVVSNDRLTRGGTVIVAPITSALWDSPVRVEIAPGQSGLRDPSHVQVDHVRSVSTQRLMTRLGAASSVTMLAVERAIMHMFDL